MMGSARLFRSYGLTHGLISITEQPKDPMIETLNKIANTILATVGNFMIIS